MALRNILKFVLHLVSEIKYQIIYYALGGIAQAEDFVFAWCNKTELVDKSGEVAVITGGARGIGIHEVRMLLQCNMHVIIGCRNPKAGDDAIAALRSAGITSGTAESRYLDTGLLNSVAKFAKSVAATHPKIHVLINNAGIMFVPFELTADGFESHQAVNYIGHFLLTETLLPNLQAGAETNPRGTKSRIVNVTSCAHLAGSINYSDFNNRDGYIASAAYAQSKLAQLISTVHLSKVFESSNVPINVYAVHPGIVNTEIFDGTSIKRFFPWAPRLFFKSPEKGAVPVIHAAISPKLENRSGIYISNCRETNFKKIASDSSEGVKLHEFTRKLIQSAQSRK